VVRTKRVVRQTQYEQLAQNIYIIYNNFIKMLKSTDLYCYVLMFTEHDRLDLIRYSRDPGEDLSFFLNKKLNKHIKIITMHEITKQSLNLNKNVYFQPYGILKPFLSFNL